MPLRFTVLASGSAGNASLLQTDEFGVLLDAGLGPRLLAQRLAVVGASWNDVHAVLLTHTHSDHWKDTTLAHLYRRRVPLYCHAEHHIYLRTYSPAFARLQAENLVRLYEAVEDLVLAPGFRCRPLPLRHDGGATFGFRFEESSDLFGGQCALAYAADLGSWEPALAEALANVDLLALEFNHDVELEYASGRSPYLIRRVLSDEGHLSNVQALALLQEVMRRSTPGLLRHVVQLHLSRECNRPSLAVATAQAALADPALGIELHTASQDKPGPTLVLGAVGNGSAAYRRARPRSRPVRSSRPSSAGQACLPGMDDCLQPLPE
jgi:phosphoribosyl 1,2-cyclic phosphodiesterase